MKLIKIFLLSAVITFSKCFCNRIYFEKCNYKGFTCKNSTRLISRTDITYQCNDITGQDITFYLWQFLAPVTTTTVMIKDCHTVHFYFGCTYDARNSFIQILHLQNVINLHIIPAALSHNPPQIIFENVTNIETIPKYTFSQITRKNFKPGCFNPTSDLDSIVFQNVKIGIVETEAFENLRSMKFFRWENVSVMRINTGGLKIEGGNYSSLQFLNSVVGVLEPLAIQITGDKVVVVGNKFTEIFSSALNGTLHTFEFSYNSVSSVQSGGFSVLAQDVNIVGNHFEHLNSGAFQKIGAYDSSKNFSYSFRQNLIRHVDAGGLHPDIAHQKNITTDIVFSNNSFYCTCEGLTWLGAQVPLGFKYYGLKDFYGTVLDPKNNNTCAFFPCNFPLKAIKRIFLTNGNCQDSTLVKEYEMCEMYESDFLNFKSTSGLTSFGRKLLATVILFLVTITIVV